MPIFRPFDGQLPLLQQLDEHIEGPVTLLDVMLVPAGQKEDVCKVWRKDALLMQQQPGAISVQLYESAGKSNLLLNIAIWESKEHFKTAYFNPIFQKMFDNYPRDLVVSQHLVQKRAVENVCLAN